MDEQFQELAQNPATKKDVLDVLVWRDLRLGDFLDFVINLEEIGGIEEFAKYDFKMKKSARVNHPSDLLSAVEIQALVHRNLDFLICQQLQISQQFKLLMIMPGIFQFRCMQRRLKQLKSEVH